MAYAPLTKIPQQFFDNLGNPLVSGTLYAYLAGTSTPTNMFSDNAGTVAGTSVVLDSRGEPTTFKLIWLNTAVIYKFVLKDSTGTTIWTIDNISGDDGTGNTASSVFDQQTITATAGQTIFNLGYEYVTGTNAMAVYKNGSRLITGTDFTETSSTSVTLTMAAIAGDEYTFIGGQDVSSSFSSTNVSFIQSGTGAVTRSVQTKLREFVSVKDFGAVGDGTTDDTAAIQAAIDYAQQRNYAVSQHYPTAINTVHVPTGLYKITSSLNITEGICLIGDGADGTYFQLAVSSAVPAISIDATGGKQIWGSIFQGFRIECFKGSVAGDGIKIRATAPSAVTQCRFSDIVIMDHRNGLDIAGTAANEVYLNEFINIKCVGPTADGSGNSAQRYGVLATTGAYNSYINIECTQVSNSGYAFFINQVGIHAVQLTCDGACDFDSLFGTVDHLTIEEVYCVTPVASQAIKVNRMQSFSNITLIEVPNSEFTTGLNIFGTGGLDIRNVNIFTATANRPNTPIYLDAASGGTISNFIGSIAAKVETYLSAATLDRWSFVQSPALTDRNVGRSVYQTSYPTTNITFPSAHVTTFTQNNVESMRITAAGLVGINNNSPATRIHAKHTSTDIVRLENTSSTGAYIDYYDTSWSCRVGGVNGELLMFTGGTSSERVRVKSTGSVRFVPLGSAPAGPQAGDVYYDSGTNKLRCYNGAIWNDLF